MPTTSHTDGHNKEEQLKSTTVTRMTTRGHQHTHAHTATHTHSNTYNNHQLTHQRIRLSTRGFSRVSVTECVVCPRGLTLLVSHSDEERRTNPPQAKTNRKHHAGHDQEKEKNR